MERAHEEQDNDLLVLPVLMRLTKTSQNFSYIERGIIQLVHIT